MKEIVLLTTFLLWLLKPESNAQNAYTLASGYELTINGTSNVHNWIETATKVTGSGDFTINADGSITLNSLTVSIDVMTIKSDKGSIMDGKTQKALKAETNPQITFKLTSPLHIPKLTAEGTLVTAKGQLNIAGIAKSVDLQVKASQREPGKILFEGSRDIKMSEFGITPPTAFAGAMRVGDAVTVKFKTFFIKK